MNIAGGATREFFATVQNKMHYAAHQHTATEVIHERVDNEKPMVGMTNFKDNYITKSDVGIAENAVLTWSEKAERAKQRRYITTINASASSG